MPFIESIQSDWPFYLVNILIFVSLILVTWLYAKARQAESVAQLQAQLQQLQMQQNQQLFDLEDAFKLKKERIRLILKDMEFQLKKKDQEMLSARRNELTNVFIMEYRESMHRFARLAHQYYELNPPKYQEFVKNYIFPFLSTSHLVLSAVNTDAIKKQLNITNDFSFSYQDFDFTFDMIRKYPNFAFKRTMKKHVEAIGFSIADLD